MMAGVFLSFLKCSIVVGLIAGSLILLTPYLNKRFASKWKYWVWIFLAFRLLIPFGATDVFLQTKVQSVGYEKDNITDASEQSGSPRRIVVEIPTQITAPLTMPFATQFSGSNARVTILDLAAITWMFGSLVFLAVYLVSYLYFKRQVHLKGAVIERPDILHQLTELKQELHIKRVICIVKFPKAPSPMMSGFIRPVLILPKELYRPEQLYFILKHELIHWKRKDVFIKLLFVAANAVHWFNPLIWMMQKEAINDMELSCDEQVIYGADYDVRKAYAEMLLSTLHERCVKRNMFLIQFYSEKQIMKMRFRNIFAWDGKRHGISILIAAVLLTVVLGTQIGYSVAKESAEVENVMLVGQSVMVKSATGKWNTEKSEKEADKQDNILKNIKQLVFFKEGEPEEKQAELVSGEEYFIYLPKGDWQQSGSDEWTAGVNEQVHLWITHFEGKSVESANDAMAAEGYVAQEYGDMAKLQGETIYKVRLYEFEGDVWGVFYCFPAEAEEGWGTELSVIADTFGLWTATDGDWIYFEY